MNKVIMVDYLCAQTLFTISFNEYFDAGDDLQDYADHYLCIAEKLKLCKLGLESRHHYYIKQLYKGTTINDLREGYLCYTLKIFNNILINFIDHNYFKTIYYTKSSNIKFPLVTNQSNYKYTESNYAVTNLTAMRTNSQQVLGDNKTCDRFIIVPYFMSLNCLNQLDIYLVYIQLNKSKGLYLINDFNLEDLTINFDKDVDEVIDEFSFYKGISLHKLFEYDNQNDKIILV